MGISPNILFILMSCTFWTWNSSSPQPLPFRNEWGAKGCWALHRSLGTWGAEREESAVASSIAPLKIFTRFVSLRSKWLYSSNLSPLPLCWHCSPSPEYQFWACLQLFICRYRVRVLIFFFFYLILYLKCFSLSHVNRLFLDLRHQSNYFFPDPAPSIRSIR